MERRLRLWAAGLVLFVVGGAFGGWWFLAGHAVGEAQAQVTSNCGPGRDCAVKSLTTTGSPPGVAVSASGRTHLGVSSGGGVSALWLGRSGPADEQWHLGATGGTGLDTYLNSFAGSVHLRQGGVNRLSLASTTLTSNAASGVNGFALATNGARLDLGSGAADYLVSNGSAIQVGNGYFEAANKVTTDAVTSFNGVGMTIRGGSGTADSLVVDTNGSAMTSGRLVKVRNNGSEVMAVTSDGSLDFVGVATGSLGTCAGLAGAIQYDTTLSCLAMCNGSSWSCLPRAASAAVSATFSNTCFGDCAELAEFSGGLKAAGAHVVQNVACSWAAAGTASGGTDAVVFEVRDQTAGSTLCTCTMAADCTVASGVVQACDCSGTMTSGNLYEVRTASASNCGSMPDNIVCNVRYVP